MKQKLPLLLMAGVLLGTTSFALPASAENMQVAQLKLEVEPRKPGVRKTGPQTPAQGSTGNFDAGVNSTAPGGYAPPPPVTYHCMPGYSKTDERRYTNGSRKGGLYKLECRSPIFECPAKSSVRTDNGSPAQGHGNEIKKIPVGAGDSNRFRIEYTCTYYWPEG